MFDLALFVFQCDRAIASDDLEQALKTTRPSLTRQEREKYETMYVICVLIYMKLLLIMVVLV